MIVRKIEWLSTVGIITLGKCHKQNYTLGNCYLYKSVGQQRRFQCCWTIAIIVDERRTVMSGGQLLSGHVRRIDTVDKVELNAVII